MVAGVVGKHRENRRNYRGFSLDSLVPVAGWTNQDLALLRTSKTHTQPPVGRPGVAGRRSIVLLCREWEQRRREEKKKVEEV